MHIEEEGITHGKVLQVEWSVARLPKEGEEYCGDRYFIGEHGQKVLVAVMDGVGHGENAKYAAQRALQTLKRYNGESLISLVKRCHAELKGTRGVVMSLALFNFKEQTMTWISVGNVDAILLRADEKVRDQTIILRGGIVGYNLPSLQATVFSAIPGDLLILTTDGVKDEYIEGFKSNANPREIVKYVSSNHFKKSDDALIFAARYVSD